MILLIRIAIVVAIAVIDVQKKRKRQLLKKEPAIWMKDIDGTKELFSLNLPGSHNSCALYDFLIESTAATQTLTLKEQLDSGIRCVDIRPYHELDGSFTIHHTVADQHMTYDEVLQICYQFLSDHPTETIIFAVYNENREDKELENIISCIRAGISKNPEYWLYSVEEDKSKLTSNITLDEARGKLVLIKRFEDAMSDYGLYEETDFYYNEPGSTSNLDTAWNKRYEMLEYVRNGNNTLYGNLWISGYYEGAFGIPNIKKMSNIVNPKFSEYLDNLDKSLEYHFGMISYDHVSWEITEKIYSLNFPEESGN